MLFAQLNSDLGPLTVASCHAPPGVTWGYVEVEHAHALLDWIGPTDGPILIGADANTPMFDHPDPDEVRTHWQTGSRLLMGRTGDDVMFGGHPQHHLQDALRRWLTDDSARLHEVSLLHPSGRSPSLITPGSVVNTQERPAGATARGSAPRLPSTASPTTTRKQSPP